MVTVVTVVMVILVTVVITMYFLFHRSGYEGVLRQAHQQWQQ